MPIVPSRAFPTSSLMETLKTKMATMQLGSLTLPSRFWLAPLAGYTNLAFRTSVRELGGLGHATTDLVNAKALIRTCRKTMDLIQTSNFDRPFAVQLYGHVIEDMVAAAKWLEGYGVTSVDINMGCPVRKVTRSGGGSALLCEGSNATTLVQKIVESVKIPVTVKMRLGWDKDNLSGPWFAREFEKIGVAAITIHGRTREQGFSGSVDLDGIRSVVEAVEKIPIIGNGDVKGVSDAKAMFEKTGCAGIAIGRGALLNPWIFQQLSTWDLTGEPCAHAGWMDRLQFMRRHFRLLVEHKGERFSCLAFRKVANWYCRVLKPGHQIQQQLVQLESPDHFEGLANQIEELVKIRPEPNWPDLECPVKVPSGPISHW